MIDALRGLRARRLKRAMAGIAEFYRRGWSTCAIRAHQLEAFNAVWAAAGTRTRYFRDLARARRLPERFSSFEEMSECLPTLDRSTIARRPDDFALEGSRPDYRRVTGGSTSEPISMPASRSEDRSGVLDTWLARAWYGVEPCDRLFLLWGHSHLLGRGIAGAVNRGIRALKDAACGYLRVSAYDLGDGAMQRAGRLLLAHRPAYLIGYSMALHRLAHVNRRHARALRSLGLKVAIATGESFPSPRSAELIEETFGCPVAMEYGAVETGILAHQQPSGGFHVFWARHYIEGLPSPRHPEHLEVVVTALYPRVVPLIRYRLGDLVTMRGPRAGQGLELDEVIGRCNDEIALSGERFVHSEAFTHVLRDVREVQAFQVIQDATNVISINYISDSPLSEATLCSIHKRLARIDRDLGHSRLVRVSRLEETLAGKTKRVISRAGSAACR